LKALFERLAKDPYAELFFRKDGMLQSGPDPKEERAIGKRGIEQLLARADCIFFSTTVKTAKYARCFARGVKLAPQKYLSFQKFGNTLVVAPSRLDMRDVMAIRHQT
jgi:hypothetical protein